MDLVQKINFAKNQSGTYWFNQANERLPGITSVVLVVLIAWYLSQIIWLFVPGQNDFDWSVTDPVGGSSSALSTSMTNNVNFAQIADAHLFGIAGTEPVMQITQDAPETQLNLKLHGTVASVDPKVAHAIIADGKGKGDVYFLEDTLPGGAVLHQVYADRVILNRSGTLETLKLPKLSESLGPTTAARSNSRSQLPSSFTNSRAATQKSAGSQSSFTDIIRPQPYMPNGEMKGYRVYPGRDRRKFASLGFRPGDLVTQINGQMLNDLQSGMEVFKNLGSASELNLTVERAGQPVELSIDMSSMNMDMSQVKATSGMQK
jgi:general secretion pathway protein C